MPALFFHIAFAAFSAFASYNYDCMKLLHPPRSPAAAKYAGHMARTVRSWDFFSPARAPQLSEVDIEVIYDLTHGLPLTAVYADGTRDNLILDLDSLARLGKKISYHGVIQTMYSQFALQQLRYVLKNSCMAMAFERCGDYDTYIGLIDNRPRPFTRKQEQAVKWATIFQKPLTATVQSLRDAGESDQQIYRRLDLLESERLNTARSLLSEQFGPMNAENLMAFFAEAYIRDAFKTIRALTAGNVVPFRK